MTPPLLTPDIAEMEAAVVDAVRSALRLCLSALTKPDNGHHYCRWCEAGTSNGWKHGDHCGYVIACRSIDEARTAANAVLSTLDTIRGSE